MEQIDLKQLALAIQTIADEKRLPEEMVHEIIEQAIAAAWRRDHGDRDQDVRAVVDQNSGDVTVYVTYQVVEEVENEAIEMTLEQAKKINKKAEIGGIVETSDKPTKFGRVAAQTAKQVVLQKLREAEREAVLQEFEDKIGSVVTGTVQRVEQRVVRVELGKGTGIMPSSEQIPGEYYRIGERIKVLIKEVERGNKGPQLVLSRATESFISHLFRQEVPEMANGSVEIKKIAREAGRRTKLAVSSNVPGVDPVGTFVGGHGTRVQAVMGEVGEYEKIDIITYSDDIETFITNALSPAEITGMTINKDTKSADVKVARDQLSIAIGRSGQNVRLASRLTEYELNVSAAEGAEEAPSEVTQPAEAKPKRKKNIEDSLLSALSESDTQTDNNETKK